MAHTHAFLDTRSFVGSSNHPCTLVALSSMESQRKQKASSLSRRPTVRKWVCAEVPGGWPSRGLTVGQATGTGPRSSKHNSTCAWHSNAFRDWTVRPEGGGRACPSCWHLTGTSLSVGKEGLRVASPTDEAQRSPRSPRKELSETRHTPGEGQGRGEGLCGAQARRALRAGPELLHLVTRRSSKALMPWAAFSRVSSLAGGPCQRKLHHYVDRPR